MGIGLVKDAGLTISLEGMTVLNVMKGSRRILIYMLIIYFELRVL